MRNRTKKEQKELEGLMGLLILVSGLVGWYMTGTLKGSGIAVGIGFGIIIIFSLLRSIRFKKRMQQSRITDIDQMTGREFEEYLGTLFFSQGYEVTYTPTTGDYGADLILKKGQEVIAVQAKRYKSSVGITGVQQVIPAVKVYNATAAWMISNSYYTKAAVTLAKHNDVRMIDRDELIQMRINLKNDAEQTVNKREESLENQEQQDAIKMERSSREGEDVQRTTELKKVFMNKSTQDLKSALIQFRKELAVKTERKAYLIFTQQTLEELVEKRPVTVMELRNIWGIGEKKIEEFGAELVEVIKSKSAYK